MSKKKKQQNSDVIPEYREESAKIPFVVMVLLVLLIGGSLGWMIFRIDTEGSLAVNVSKYNMLIQTVSSDMQDISTILKDDSVDMEERKHTVTLIVPEVVLVDERKPEEGPAPLKVDLKGIYWSPSNPLVDIDNETYYVGDVIQGYTIVKISKTAVHFKAKDGTLVVKDFYENLLQNKK